MVPGAHGIYDRSAAVWMSRTTSLACETMATWLEWTSTVSASMRLANRRWASGGMASSFVATRYQAGSDFQAGTSITSVNVLAASGCWTANITRARAASTSAAKWLGKSFSESQT